MLYHRIIYIFLKVKKIGSCLILDILQRHLLSIFNFLYLEFTNTVLNANTNTVYLIQGKGKYTYRFFLVVGPLRGGGDPHNHYDK